MIHEILETKATKMNPEIRDKWVQRLKEFDKEEVRRFSARLKTNDEYSVMGVLCDLYLEEKGLKWDVEKVKPNPNINLKFSHKYLCCGNVELLPDEVKEWAGLKRTDPIFESIRTEATRCTLAMIEANPRLPFTYFANLIQKEL